MAKCEKCGEEYPDDTEHLCSSPSEESQQSEKKVEEEAPHEDVPKEETTPTE